MRCCWRYLLTACFIFQVIVGASQSFAQEGEFQLASPSMVAKAIFFEKQTSVAIDLDVEGVTIRYTEDGSQPNESSQEYTDEISVAENTKIKAKAWHPNFKPSEVVELSVYNMNGDRDMVLDIQPPPSESYPGKGVAGLTDKEKGTANFRDGKWLGFSADTITMNVQFTEALDVPLFNLSVLEDQASWIFLPASIEVWIDDEQVTLWEKDRFPDQLKSFQYIQFTIPRKNVQKASIKVMMDTIPEWHPGAGTIPWFFIDEVFISK